MTMKAILGIVMMLVSMHVFAGTAPNGAGIILEKGKNIAINDEEDPQ